MTDVVLVVWVVAWVLIGVAIYHQVRDLSTLSDTLDSAAAAVDETGSALDTLSKVPFVGGQIKGLADRVHAAAATARTSAATSRKSTQDLSTLLGVPVALAPTAPLVALYAPLRIRRVREVRGMRRALIQNPEDASLRKFLAHRALQNVPYDRVRAVTDDPWGDIEGGRFDPLARLELDRLGVGATLPSTTSSSPRVPT